MYQDKPPIEEFTDELFHYGTKRHSGRYPWGSGDEPYQNSGDFLSRVEELRKKDGFVDENGKKWTGDMAVAKAMNMSSTDFRVQVSLAKAERRQLLVEKAESLKADGKSLRDIASELGYPNESSVRSLLNQEAKNRMKAAQNTADFLKRRIDELQEKDPGAMIDVGAGADRELGISSKEKLNQALEILRIQGYPTYGGGLAQVTNPGQQTILRCLCPPGTEPKDIYQTDKIHAVLKDYESHDGGETFKPAFVYPSSLDSKRVMIRYAEDGGLDRDGTIELRRGCKDLDLGESHYAQVRILVDGKSYMKGMALYSDDLPKGVDVVFNTNKPGGTPMAKVLKDIKRDKNGNPLENPFGSLIKEKGGQSYYIDDDGKEKLSLINKRGEEGDWNEWKQGLPSQFLGKQNKTLIEKQLKIATDDRVAEYKEICALTNPVIKKKLLEEFANGCDSTAVHLEAAALPRQKYKVILPVPTLKDTEVYAPSFIDGETVALVRYPHGGTFEIPVLKVNNKQADAKRILGTTPKDAIGINKKVADKLSGADFDGDTVMVIPCNSTFSKTRITARDSLKGLKDFDPGMEYPERPGMKYMTKGATQNEMGKISNLITDMTIKGATDEELTRAVKHSMVVIDAYKHKYDYKKSEKDNGILQLKQEYQGHYDEDGNLKTGASTLLSRAKSQTSVLKRQGSSHINQKGKVWYDPTKPEGAIVYKSVEEEYTVTKTSPKTGKVSTKTQIRTQKSNQMSETDDARTLSSGTPKEEIYANYANTMKSLANSARKEIISAPRLKTSASAKETYKREVDHLLAQLNLAEKNAPRERRAQMLANSEVNAKKEASEEELSKAEIKKISQQALTKARLKVGASRTKITISDKEWEAIQAGALSEDRLSRITKYADTAELRSLATPRSAGNALSQTKINRINSLKAMGYTTEQIASSMNVSASTVTKYL